MANRVKEIRQERGIPQMELAAKVGTPTSHLVFIEKYGHRPEADLQQRIASALNCTPEELFPKAKNR